MKCWVCNRGARGARSVDLRHAIGDPRRYPLDWVFCSQRCQDTFQRLYTLRVDAERRGEEVAVIDASEVERAAMRQCLKAFGSAAEAIGFDRPLGSYSEAEALQVIDAIVTEFTTAMTDHHAATVASPIRGMTPPADGFKDDLPWEAK